MIYPKGFHEPCGTCFWCRGALGETLVEIGKYHPVRVDYVELDPALTRTALALKMIPRVPFLNIINTDARLHTQSTDTRYDAVIFDLPEPDIFYQ